MEAMAGDEAYDELFSAPVEDFVARRDALVKQLKAERRQGAGRRREELAPAEPGGRRR